MSKLQPLLFFALALAIVLWLRSEALFYGSLAVELRALIVAPAFVFALLGLRPFLSPYLRSTAAFFGIFLAAQHNYACLDCGAVLVLELFS